MRPLRLLTIVAGFLIWHLAFIALYALLSVGCEFGWDRTGLGAVSLQRLALLALWAAHLGALGVLLWFVWRLRRGDQRRDDTSRFIGFVAFGSTVWALLATVPLGLPLFRASACL